MGIIEWFRKPVEALQQDIPYPDISFHRHLYADNVTEMEFLTTRGAKVVRCRVNQDLATRCITLKNQSSIDRLAKAQQHWNRIREMEAK